MQLAPRLLFISSLIWTVYCGSKCPPEFKLFQRTPTDKNNHTKEWCLGVINYSKNMVQHEVARSHCISLNSSLSIPENQMEFDTLMSSFNKSKFAVWRIGCDGEMRKACKIERLRHGFNFDFRKFKGECNLQNQLFEFDDANTDPSFIKSKLVNNQVPNQINEMSEGGFPGSLKTFGDCVYVRKFNDTLDISVGTTECYGEKNAIVRSVICGRHPL